ncbi:MAG: AmmeMemoRadiSam system protein B [Rhodospirillales bacterium]|nr:AmmeMemoRadiSam system protein B [Rhodospirillales bacterium]
MATARPAAVAGAFYDDNPQRLTQSILHYLVEAEEKPESKGKVPKAIIAPHAGYVYSGSVAATAYARIKPAKETIKRVVLLGPCHRVAVQGLAMSSADYFLTPLGRIPLDKQFQAKITELPQVTTFDATHAQEHSLEVHLPFLQTLIREFILVPLVVGNASPEQVAEVLETLWGGPETLIVISTDLSHYLNYEQAHELDGKTKNAIENFDIDSIGNEQACGRIPVKGLLHLANKKGMEISTVDFRNSGDTAGPKNRVVGYGSWVLIESENEVPQNSPNPDPTDAFAQQTKDILEKHGTILLQLAAASIESGLDKGVSATIVPTNFSQDLQANGAAFVTLEKNGRLRGCIGSLQAHQPLVEDVVQNAFKAAFGDPRFPNLGREELKDLTISISVLSPAAPMNISDEADLLRQLRPGVDGLIIMDLGRRSLFLPQVWDQLSDPIQFLAHLKQKAGLPVDHWSDGFKAWRFITEGVKQAQLSDPMSIWNEPYD